MTVENVGGGKVSMNIKICIQSAGVDFITVFNTLLDIQQDLVVGDLTEEAVPLTGILELDL